MFNFLQKELAPFADKIDQDNGWAGQRVSTPSYFQSLLIKLLTHYIGITGCAFSTEGKSRVNMVVMLCQKLGAE